MYDTIIIGAGLSGLAAGIRLAHYDRKVCILERHNTIGGLNSFYRLNSRDFDVGLHAVTNFTPKGARKGPLARVLVAYAKGQKDVKPVVDKVLKDLGIPATALFSTLGRTAARGIEAVAIGDSRVAVAFSMPEQCVNK